jgi:hypothetical protein
MSKSETNPKLELMASGRGGVNLALRHSSFRFALFPRFNPQPP